MNGENYKQGDNLKDTLTLKEQLINIAEHYSQIYVREKINGKWGSYSLAMLPDKIAASNVIRLIERYKNEK